MGTERLKDAARAAGFAMAVDERKPEDKPDTAPWSASDGALLEDVQAEPPKAAASVTDWVKGVFGVFGRGAPA